LEKQEDYKNEEPVFHRAKLGKTETESRISTNNRFNKWNFKPQGFICVLREDETPGIQKRGNLL
jgi:hypothetical protein